MAAVRSKSPHVEFDEVKILEMSKRITRTWSHEPVADVQAGTLAQARQQGSPRPVHATDDQRWKGGCAHVA
jgi:hypothetical protein